ncbi:hypothetical protein DDZ13_02835 [Coraliomargarita sinensis]|uniref:VWFA domain-containing protein n=1 Tax=Coraliomargarita sinensis TaxID=2174842 RepID=A0A317ZL65_9BACT|nr:VWA domain-containing protein [Coraliomargarita sinensis]PXA04917.1 hypothetical protein DDZ13_02835 [Coraliomargarita sinensis]
MTFEAPIWLALTPVLTLISISLVLLGWRKRSQLLGRFAAARLLDRLTEKASVQRRLLKSALIVAAVSLLGLALARPQYGVEWSERKARGLDIVFALDSSKSMLATDLRPTRLERGKLAILDLIDRLESDRIGLVAFAGQAFLQTPPTLDYGAFRESLNATDPSILSRGGSDLGRAIEEAAKAFPSETNVKVVVLLTDGEDLGGQALEAARTAAEDGIQIFTIGIGTPQGEYLRIRNEQGIEEFVRDRNDQPVRSQLDEATLQQIAQLTGGSYSRLGGSSLEALYDSVLATLPREERESELQEVRIERFQWLLTTALAFLILEIVIRSRRPRASQAALLLLSLLMVSPNPAEATPYNEAHTALTEGDYATANELYTEAMRQTNDRSLQRDALYNMGHATYQLGRADYDQGDAEGALKRIRSAEKLFESALELDPNDNTIRQDLERTRKVRETIEQFLEQQKEQENQQQEEQEQQDSEQSDEQDASDSEASEDQKEEGSEQENEQKQQQSQEGESGEQEQSGEEQSGQPQNEESQSGEQQEGEQDSESPSGQEEPSDEPSGSNQSEPGESDEQDTPEPTPGESQEENEETGESTEPVPQVGEPEESESGEQASGAAQSSANAQIEGMTIKEAQDLLDSLRGKEEILPFAKPTPGKGRPIQDW